MSGRNSLYSHRLHKKTLEYGELKMELAYRFSEDIEGYCTGKDAFVKQLEKDALLWYQNNESYKTR